LAKLADTMTKKIKVSELPEFDVAECLNSEEDVAAYLTSVLEENDPALLATALGDIARSRGMTDSNDSRHSQLIQDRGRKR
jgi:DNA-binding phage protein